MRKKTNISFPIINYNGINLTSGRIIYVDVFYKKEIEKQGEANKGIKKYAGHEEHHKFKDIKIYLYMDKFYKDVLTKYYGKFNYGQLFYEENKPLEKDDPLFDPPKADSYSSMTLVLLVLLEQRMAEYYVDILKKEGHRKFKTFFDDICLSGSYHPDIIDQLKEDYDEEQRYSEHEEKEILAEDVLKVTNEIKNILDGKDNRILNRNNCITSIDSVKEKFQTYIQHIKSMKLKGKLLFLYVADEDEPNEEELINSMKEEYIQFEVLNKDKLSIENKTSEPTLYVKKINPKYYPDKNNTTLFDDIMSNVFPNIETPSNSISEIEKPSNPIPEIEKPSNLIPEIETPSNSIPEIETPSNSIPEIEKPSNPVLEKAPKILISTMLMLAIITIFSLTFFVRLDDPQLDRAIKDELGINLPFITIFDTHRLKTLSADNKNIKSIKGLEKFNLLTKLSLTDNEIVNISALGKLTKLEKLDLSGNKINELYPISGLEKLKELNLSRNSIAFVDAILKLKELREINLNYNRIENIAPIINLFEENSKLTDVTIHIEDNKIDLNQNSPNYKSLMKFLQNEDNNTIKIHYSRGNIPNNIILIPDDVLRKQIKEQFYGTEKYISLESVSSRETCKIINITNGNCIFRYDGTEQEKISNLRGLEYFTNIEELHLPNNNIRDIFVVKYLSELNTLCLNNNEIEDITPLKYIDAVIKILVLTNNEIKNFDPINFLIEKKMINNETYIDVRYNRLNVNKVITNEGYHIYTDPQKNN